MPTKKVTRKGDQDTGHGCYPPRPSSQGSPDVFTEGIATHRVGDAWSSHCCGPPCHSSKLAAGSTTVFANGKGKGRIDDPVECGSYVAIHAATVYAGG